MQPSSACISPKGSIGPLKTQCYWPCPYNSLYCSLSAVNIPGYHPIPTISICHYPPCPYNQYFFMAGLVKCQLGLSLFTIPPLRQYCTHYAPPTPMWITQCLKSVSTYLKLEKDASLGNTHATNFAKECIADMTRLRHCCICWVLWKCSKHAGDHVSPAAPKS